MIKIGDVFKTDNYGSCTVIEFIDSRNVKVRFENGFEIICQASNLRGGHVKNPNHPSISGIGYIGVGNYSRTSHPRIYMVWFQMLRRCYDLETQSRQQSYIGCIVCERWWNFQNFCHDYLLMMISDLNWQLDKDILFKGNKIYSPETCCLVPQEINNVLEKCNANRGEFRIGVTYDERYINPYIAQCSIKGKYKYLGSYKTEQEAYLTYKVAKETEFKRLANFYKNLLESRVYVALMNRVVEFND
jgi:hypothetical protein